MNKLRGIDNTTIIDDTYNSSPLAAESSLRVLYQLSVPQRIVVFGDMNELTSRRGFRQAYSRRRCGNFI